MSSKTKSKLISLDTYKKTATNKKKNIVDDTDKKILAIVSNLSPKKKIYILRCIERELALNEALKER